MAGAVWGVVALACVDAANAMPLDRLGSHSILFERIPLGVYANLRVFVWTSSFVPIPIAAGKKIVDLLKPFRFSDAFIPDNSVEMTNGVIFTADEKAVRGYFLTSYQYFSDIAKA